MRSRLGATCKCPGPHPEGEPSWEDVPTTCPNCGLPATAIYYFRTCKCGKKTFYTHHKIRCPVCDLWNLRL